MNNELLAGDIFKLGTTGLVRNPTVVQTLPKYQGPFPSLRACHFQGLRAHTCNKLNGACFALMGIYDLFYLQYGLLYCVPWLILWANLLLVIGVALPLHTSAMLQKIKL